MDKKTLVKSDIDQGKTLLRVLDKAGINIPAAFWFYQSDSENWRLMIASPIVDKDGPIASYKKILSAMKKTEKITDIAFDDITLMSPSNDTVKLLSKVIKTSAKATDNIRFTNNAINNVIIEDALIYRMTKQSKRNSAKQT
ncbi:MAG: hypothetical protein AMJ79_01570 [Phycisphaerae bacterium SM23_30]|nr:MAG: hypothetical protein AMJ79_01570 [Phycisphaerae bacterium SM23_30]